MGSFTNVMRHFIQVYTVKIKKNTMSLFVVVFLNYNLTPLYICTMNYPKCSVSNQKEESNSIQRVKYACAAYLEGNK